jgi:glycerophosphoryl diester phosphodiesterase
VFPITFAHRGARAHHPENTLPAFHAALERGVGGLETDAWLSSDGEVVLVHDHVVWTRMLGIIPRRIGVASSPAPRLHALGIPRLNDLYRELGADYELSIDLKMPGVGERIIDLARAVGDPRRLWLCSPARRVLHPLRELAPEIHLVHSQSRSRLPEAVERHAADLAAANIDAMNMHHSEWSAGLVALFHRFDVRAFAWDVQEVRHLRRALSYGIDAVYCDYPARMVETVAAWNAEQAWPGTTEEA